MSRGNRRRWSLRLVRWHRWAGITAAVLVLVLATSGLALQHAAGLGLDRAAVGSAAAARLLGLRAGEVEAVRVDGLWVAALRERLFVDGRGLGAGDGTLHGALRTELGIAVAYGGDVLLVGPDGRLLERLGADGALPGRITAIGRGPAGVVVRTASGDVFRPIDGWLRFRPHEGPVPEWSRPAALPADDARELRERALARALTWERLLLELHSGRIGGTAGQVVVDLAAVGLLVLSATGIYLWWRRR